MAPSFPELDRARELAGQALAWSGDGAIELEAAIKGDISPMEFSQVVSAVVALDGASAPVETLQLDCLGAARRWEFVGEDRIRAFMRRGHAVGPAADRVIEKKSVGATVKLSEFPIVLRLKSERLLPAKGAFVPAADTLQMRLKRRLSVTFEEDGVRVDMTAVMKSSTVSRELHRSRSHEVEVEALPPRQGATRTADEVARMVLGYAHACYCAIRGTSSPVSDTERARILSAYDGLTGYSSGSRGSGGVVGFDLVTLVTDNLQPPGLGVVSVREGYTVTDKADGERRWLLVADGGAYLLDSRKNMVRAFENVPKHLDGTLLDGELITESKLASSSMRLFAVFDAYWASGRSVAARPLMSAAGKQSRLAAAKDVVRDLEKCAPVDDLVVKVKDFVLLKKDAYGEQVAAALRAAEALPYRNDGLVFTPAGGAVGSLHDDDDKPALSGRWMRALKWKPPSHNSVDFLVRVKKDKKRGGEVLHSRQVTLPNGADVTVRSKTVTLWAAYNPAKNDPIDPIDYLTRGSAAIPKEGYVAKLFEYPGHPGVSECVLDITEGRLLCENGEALEDDTIVEFKWDGGWSPMRVRHDKTEKYVNTKTPTANNWQTARSVFSSIVHPVTVDMITGRAPAPPLPDDDAVYYTDESSDALKQMRNFHNLVVKADLYDKYATKGGSLLELGCGEGGDINRWLANDLSMVVGIDKSRNNIVNPDKGVYARWDKATARRTDKPRGVFLTLDATVRMFAPHDEIKAAAAEYDQIDMVAAMWGLPGTVLPALEPFKGVMTRGFDLVSCQFSIHYMFQTSATLDRFVNNVARMTKPGGYFICTTFDGDLVAAAMGARGSIAGRVGGRVLWSIARAEGQEYKRFDGETGVAIDVFVGSIGKPAREYLVSRRTLEARMERAGFELVASELFRDAHSRATATKKLPAQLSPAEKDLSFLYRSFAFKKAAKVPRRAQK
jgi:SAM-dependent methyltransferase